MLDVRIVQGSHYGTVSDWQGGALQKLLYWFNSNQYLEDNMGDVLWWDNDLQHRDLGLEGSIPSTHALGEIAQLVRAQVS
jgi:hypothetical protein